MSKPADLINRALAYSTKNRPEWATDRASELFDLIEQARQGIYLFGAAVNPVWFGVTETIALAAGAWARPATALSVYYITTATGVEVIVVPESQKDADPSRPAVFQRGGSYLSAGNDNDPSSGSLTFSYAKQPVRPADANTDYDASWNSNFDGLLITELAMYMALGDGRVEEAAQLQPTRDQWAAQFAAWLQIETTNRVYARRVGRSVSIPDLIRTTLVQVPTAPQGVAA